jgi:hypothetical protein
MSRRRVRTWFSDNLLLRGIHSVRLHFPVILSILHFPRCVAASMSVGMLMIVAMLYVEKDLSQCVKVAFDKWDTHREVLNHRYFYVANMRISPYQYAQAIEKGIFPRRRGDTLFSSPLLFRGRISLPTSNQYSRS